MAERGNPNRIQEIILNCPEEMIDGMKIPEVWLKLANAHPAVWVGRIVVTEVFPDDNMPTCLEGVAFPVIDETPSGWVAAASAICFAVMQDARTRNDLQAQHGAKSIGAVYNVGRWIPKIRVPGGLLPLAADAEQVA